MEWLLWSTVSVSQDTNIERETFLGVSQSSYTLRSIFRRDFFRHAQQSARSPVDNEWVGLSQLLPGSPIYPTVDTLCTFDY